jgi:hypothetical protein
VIRVETVLVLFAVREVIRAALSANVLTSATLKAVTLYKTCYATNFCTNRGAAIGAKATISTCCCLKI